MSAALIHLRMGISNNHSTCCGSSVLQFSATSRRRQAGFRRGRLASNYWLRSHGWAQPKPRLFSSSRSNAGFDGVWVSLGAILRFRSIAFKRDGRGSSATGFKAFSTALIAGGGCGFSAAPAHAPAENRQLTISITMSGLRITCLRSGLHVDNLYVKYQVLAGAGVVAVQHGAALRQG